MGFNHWALFDAVSSAVPDRTAMAFSDRKMTFAQLRDRSRQFARVLVDHGVRVPVPRSALAGWESGQDHVGLYLYNGNEYLEATFGADAARAVPFNINYRYLSDELAYLLDDANTAVLVYHSAFAPTLEPVLARLRRQPFLVQVTDESGNGLLPGAVEYEAALAASGGSDALSTEPDPDDLYILYTGGTTGMPKGTLWTQAGIYDAALAGFAVRLGGEHSSIASVVEAVLAAPTSVALPLPPFMHGASQWVAIGNLLTGATLAIQDHVTSLDPADIWRTIVREQVQSMIIVGDAFARPLCDELERGTYDTSSLVFVATGGAVTSPAAKQRLLALMPHVLIADVGGSSETGSQLSQFSSSGGDTSSGVFTPVAGTCVVDDAMAQVVGPGHAGIGWLARQGTIPLGYLGDRAKTERTFPVIDGQRMVVPGDRARVLADGRIELLGRESVTINTGGEKVFAEEVEQALLSHVDIDDVLVVGRASERWGQEIVAVVQLRPEATANDDALLASAAGRLARYKLPKAIVRVEAIRRSPAGKADYGWARNVASDAGG